MFDFFGPPNILSLKEKKDVNGLIKALDFKKDKTIRREAAIALGDLHANHAIPSLIASADDEEISVKLAAISAIGEINDKSGIDFLLSILGSKDKRIKKATAIALSKTKNTRFIPQFIELLHEPEIQSIAADFLIQNNEKSIQPLISKYCNEKSPLKKQIIQILGKLEDQKAHENLLNLFSSADEAEIKYEISEVLLKNGSDDFIDVLINRTKSDDWTIRAESAKLLAYGSGQKIIDSLISLLNDNDTSVRRESIEALSKIAKQKINGSRCIERLISIVKNESETDNIRFQSAILITKMTGFDTLQSDTREYIQRFIKTITEKDIEKERLKSADSERRAELAQRPGPSVDDLDWPHCELCNCRRSNHTMKSVYPGDLKKALDHGFRPLLAPRKVTGAEMKFNSMLFAHQHNAVIRGAPIDDNEIFDPWADKIRRELLNNPDRWWTVCTECENQIKSHIYMAQRGL